MIRPRSKTTVLAAGAVLAAAALPASAAGQSQAMAVTASLAGCQEASPGIVCQIDVAFDTLAQADHYTARVRAPGGEVSDFGQVGTGTASLPVAYAGVGRYVVTISAWAAETGDRQRIARDASGDRGANGSG